MPLPAQTWTVSCRSCDLVIGAVEDGRFVHDAACTEPLMIGAGLLRCCQCGGRLHGEARPVAIVDLEIAEPPTVSVLKFVRPGLHEDTRQRL